MAQNPPIKNVAFDILTQRYGAVNFLDALANFLIQVNNPGVSGSALRLQASNLLIPFSSIPIFISKKEPSYNCLIMPYLPY